MSNYKDRGILKWAPFDALDGHSSMIEEMIFNINKKQKRSLSEDEFEELNKTLEIALKGNKAVAVEYYKNGYSYTTYGQIKKVDSIDKKLYLDSGESLDFDSILEMNILR